MLSWQLMEECMPLGGKYCEEQSVLTGRRGPQELLLGCKSWGANAYSSALVEQILLLVLCMCMRMLIIGLRSGKWCSRERACQ
jgi:hypothetical protein